MDTFNGYVQDINVYDVYRKCYGLSTPEIDGGDRF